MTQADPWPKCLLPQWAGRSLHRFEDLSKGRSRVQWTRGAPTSSLVYRTRARFLAVFFEALWSSSLRLSSI